MYNPSRGGVRGGADQFTWESVKTDKHRENYLGHSLKAPVGRSLKGKDITWYAKERKDAEGTKSIEKSELAAIKRAEQEAMLIALGHNVVKKESQELTKEEMTEALKRNVGDRDDLNIERVGGVGARSKAAHLTGTRNKNEGVAFETRRERAVVDDNYKEQSPPSKKMKSKKSKKHKKERKRSHNKNDSENSEDESTVKKKHRSEKSKKYNDTSDSETDNVSKHKHKKEKKLKKKENISYSDDSNSGKRYKEKSSKKDRDIYDSCESDNQSSSRKKHKRHHDLSDINSSKTKHKKKLKHRHHNSNDSENDSRRTHNKRHRNQENDVHLKRHRHYTSESD
ncbi:multiple myeloma tumor-associated protein 2 homolog [Trichonephila clavata]|uniref:Multiple myeloma tumor-associated protein 2 homolog n=1 Tax=Trichonephila clavata TaxID=2740835 RepID=A0A8X6KS56_TRICU|nr:multiple myeloma tumor-associated protein 2 homolog [Trichonephila clavata]